MISADTTQFTANIEQFIAKAKGKLREAAVETIQDINEEIVLSTPGPGNTVQVDPPPGQPTGFLRASWYAALNAPATGPGGSNDVAQLNLTASSIQLGDVYYMNNGAAYAMRVEFGFIGTDSLGRKYNQQPRAFVRSVLDRASTIAEAAAARVAAT